jgi:hypothetical protein
MDDKEDLGEESPQAIEEGSGEPLAVPEPAAEAAADSPPPVPDPVELDPSKPGLYLLRPAGLRPAPRPGRRRRARLRNDCPPDRRRVTGRPPLKPRLR